MTQISSEKLVPLEEGNSNSNDSNRIPAKAKRRSFSQSYKLEILRRLEECKGKRGAVGDLLRREGLYSAQVASWKKDLNDSLTGIVKKRGPKKDGSSEARQKIARLERENARLNRRLAEAEAVIDIQKKLSDLLGLKLPDQP